MDEGLEPVQTAEAAEASRCRPELLTPAGVNVGSVAGRKGVEPVRGGGCEVRKARCKRISKESGHRAGEVRRVMAMAARVTLEHGGAAEDRAPSPEAGLRIKLRGLRAVLDPRRGGHTMQRGLIQNRDVPDVLAVVVMPPATMVDDPGVLPSEVVGPVVRTLVPGVGGCDATPPAADALGVVGWPNVDCSHSICSGVNGLAMDRT